MNEFKTENVRHEKWRTNRQATYMHLMISICSMALENEKNSYTCLSVAFGDRFVISATWTHELILILQLIKPKSQRKIKSIWRCLWRRNEISTNTKIQAWWMLIYLFSLFCLERRFIEIDSIRTCHRKEWNFEICVLSSYCIKKIKVYEKLKSGS